MVSTNPQTCSNSCSGLKGCRCNQCSAVCWSLPSRPEVPAFNVRWTFCDSLLYAPPPSMRSCPRCQPCDSAPRHWRDIQFNANARKRSACGSLISCMTICCTWPFHDMSNNQQLPRLLSFGRYLDQRHRRGACPELVADRAMILML
jgi:hypothetical protein